MIVHGSRSTHAYVFAIRGAILCGVLFTTMLHRDARVRADSDAGSLRIVRTVIHVRGDNVAHAFEVLGPDRRTSGAVYFPAAVRLTRARATTLSITLYEEHSAVLERAREEFAGLTSGGRWLIRWFPRMGTGGVVSVRFRASWVRGGAGAWRQWIRRVSDPPPGQGCVQFSGEDDLALPGIEHLAPVCIR
jgi:hypothetical protein